MSFIIDRLILIGASILMLTELGHINYIIVIGLLSVVVSGVSYYVDNKKILMFIGIVYMAFCIFFPQLIYIAPVVMYEMYGNKFYIEMLFMIFVDVVGFMLIDDISVRNILFNLLFQVIACMLYAKSAENEHLHVDVIHIRDDSEERNMLLAEKNKHLIEKQDSEIYVATLKERNRIAREIHDNVGHMLTRSILQMGALMTINKEEPLHGQLESVKNNLDVAMNNIRESVHDLHDESIDLKQGIKDLIEEIKNNFHCTLDYDVSNHVDRKYKYAIIGIVREGISNIIKHSESDNVDIIVREHPGMYQLIIHDYNDKNKLQRGVTDRTNTRATDNIGKYGGIGLQNMQDRVNALKGNISIDNRNGYKIVVTFPKQ